MRDVGLAINDTFKLNNAGVARAVSAPCGDGVATLDVSGEFDFVVSMEDLSRGQRIGNYSVDFMRRGGTEWEVLVPPVQKKVAPRELGDRPDGHDPRDQYVGHKRIDVPVVATSGRGAVPIERVRFNCIRVLRRPELGPTSQVHLRQFSLHKKRVPW